MKSKMPEAIQLILMVKVCPAAFIFTDWKRGIMLRVKE